MGGESVSNNNKIINIYIKYMEIILIVISVLCGGYSTFICGSCYKDFCEDKSNEEKDQLVYQLATDGLPITSIVN
jgi:hypothetical protein